MRELIEAADASHEASIRLALDAAGIEAVCERRRRMPTRFLLVHDDDFARASRIVGDLQHTPIELLAESPRLRRAQLTVGFCSRRSSSTCAGRSCAAADHRR